MTPLKPTAGLNPRNQLDFSSVKKNRFLLGGFFVDFFSGVIDFFSGENRFFLGVRPLETLLGKGSGGRNIKNNI